MGHLLFDDILKNDTTEYSEEPAQDSFNIFKTDDDKRLVFGWASISVTVDGEQLEDRQKDIIDPEDLEAAAYEYVLNFRDTGEEHIQTMRKKGKLVESCVFTEEKQQAMGIPEGIVPVGWWIGFKIEDDAAWERVKNGTYKMFSIEGKASREPVQKAVQKAMSFEDVLKFNPYHDADGKFTSANGGSGAASSAGGFKKATTIEEATEYARKELGFSGEVDFSYREKDENGKFVKKTLDVETVNSINEQIAEIQSKYPELKGYVKDLYCDDLDHSYAAINYSHEYGEASLIIGAGAYKNGIQYVKEQYAKDVEKKFHPYGTDERAIIWHEYGHAYAMQQAEKTVPADQKSKAIHEHHMEKSWMSQATNKLLDDPKVRMEYEMLGMNLTPASVKSAISNVSKYAQKDVVETFAEQFAAHHCRQSGKTNMYGTALLEAAGIKVQKSMPVADGWNR